MKDTYLNLKVGILPRDIESPFQVLSHIAKRILKQNQKLRLRSISLAFERENTEQVSCRSQLLWGERWIIEGEEGPAKKH